MDDASACPNCKARLHPQDVDELFRGRKLTCPACGFELRATANRVATVIGSLLLAGLPWLLPWLVVKGNFWLPLVLMALISALAWASPPGLIAGAPWVLIRAKEPADLAAERRLEQANRDRERLRN